MDVFAADVFAEPCSHCPDAVVGRGGKNEHGAFVLGRKSEGFGVAEIHQAEDDGIKVTQCSKPIDGSVGAVGRESKVGVVAVSVGQETCDVQRVNGRVQRQHVEAKRGQHLALLNQCRGRWPPEGEEHLRESTEAWRIGEHRQS